MSAPFSNYGYFVWNKNIINIHNPGSQKDQIWYLPWLLLFPVCEVKKDKKGKNKSNDYHLIDYLRPRTDHWWEHWEQVKTLLLEIDDGDAYTPDDV